MLIFNQLFLFLNRGANHRTLLVVILYANNRTFITFLEALPIDQISFYDLPVLVNKLSTDLRLQMLKSIRLQLKFISSFRRDDLCQINRKRLLEPLTQITTVQAIAELVKLCLIGKLNESLNHVRLNSAILCIAIQNQIYCDINQ